MFRISHQSVFSSPPNFSTIFSIVNFPSRNFASILVPTAQLNVNMTRVTPEPFRCSWGNRHWNVVSICNYLSRLRIQFNVVKRWNILVTYISWKWQRQKRQESEKERHHWQSFRSMTSCIVPKLQDLPTFEIIILDSEVQKGKILWPQI